MLLYNQGKRAFTYGKSEDGANLVLNVGKHVEIEKATAMKLLKMYPSEIIVAGDNAKEVQEVKATEELEAPKETKASKNAKASN